jgi:hypothetical protein
MRQEIENIFIILELKNNLQRSSSMFFLHKQPNSGSFFLTNFIEKKYFLFKHVRIRFRTPKIKKSIKFFSHRRLLLLGFASGGESEGEKNTVFAFGGESEGEDGRRE